jgi:hypothetical protein
LIGHSAMVAGRRRATSADTPHYTQEHW